MKTKYKIENKSELVKAAQTVGADLRADAFWAAVQRDIEVLSGNAKPDEIKRRPQRET